VEHVSECDEFVVLACDGLWNVMASQQVCACAIVTVGLNVDRSLLSSGS
jgi:serine/threonine protein phosphatase PrpC